jgi:hypothetical protein
VIVMTTTSPSTSALPTGKRVNHWNIISVDQTGKRVVAQCQCGAVQQIAASALHKTRCANCQPVSAAQRKEIREDETQRRARRERDWRPQR